MESSSSFVLVLLLGNVVQTVGYEDEEDVKKMDTSRGRVCVSA